MVAVWNTMVDMAMARENADLSTISGSSAELAGPEKARADPSANSAG